MPTITVIPRTDIFRNNAYDYLLTSRRTFDQISKDHSFSLNFNSTLDTLDSNVKISFDFMSKKFENPLQEEDIHHRTLVSTKLTEQNLFQTVLCMRLELLGIKNTPIKDNFH